MKNFFSVLMVLAFISLSLETSTYICQTSIRRRMLSTPDETCASCKQSDIDGDWDECIECSSDYPYMRVDTITRTSCSKYSVYGLVNGMECCFAEDDCPSGTYKYVDGDIKLCVQCHLSCLKCNGGNSDDCSSCYTGNYLHLTTASDTLGSCTLYECTEDQKSDALGGTCYEDNQCPTGTYEHEGKCVDACPLGYQLNTETSICLLKEAGERGVAFYPILGLIYLLGILL